MSSTSSRETNGRQPERTPVVGQPVIEQMSLAATFEIAGVVMLAFAAVFVIGNRWLAPPGEARIDHHPKQSDD